MKRFIVGMLLAAALVLSGCSSRSGAEADIDPATAAAALLEQVDFVRRDSMMEVSGDVASIYYSLGDEVVDYAIYINGFGASAEEIAVLKVADKKDAPAAEAAVRARLEMLSASFQDYLPEEMVKINNAVVETRGTVVFFVAADDPQQAKEAIDSLYK